VDGAFEQQVAVKVLQPEAEAKLDRFHAKRHRGATRLVNRLPPVAESVSRSLAG
jgi:hypothetical protein